MHREALESQLDARREIGDLVGNHSLENVERTTNEIVGEKVKASGKSVSQLAEAHINGSTNDSDMYGDGDQSRVKADLPTDPGQMLRTMWSTSGDFYEQIQHAVDPGASTFMVACFYGNHTSVKSQLDTVSTHSDVRQRLLERRETTLRFSPLLACICGAKNADHFQMKKRFPGRVDHFKTVELLCAAGADVNAKDVAGYTPVHHCTSSSCNDYSLAICRLLVHEYNANTEATNRFGSGPTHEAAMQFSDKKGSFETLLSLGAKADGTTMSLIQYQPDGQHFVANATMPWRSRRLQAGDCCSLRGLVKKEEYNGRVGIVDGLVYSSGRFTVRVAKLPENITVVAGTGVDGIPPRTVLADVDVAFSLSVKRENLMFDSCDSCGSLARSSCSRCGAARYCSRECQVAHYQAHKKVCVKSKAAKTASGGGSSTVLVLENGAGGAFEHLDGTVSMIDMKRGSSKSRGSIDSGVRLSNGKLKFAVKVQVPISGHAFNREAGRSFVYNKKRSFAAFADASKYDELKKFIDSHGKAGVKVYLYCEYDKTADRASILLSPSNIAVEGDCKF